LPILDNRVLRDSMLNIAPWATAARLFVALKWWIMPCYHLTIYPGSWLSFFVITWQLWQHQVSVAAITFVQNNIRRAVLYFHCLLCGLGIGDLSRRQHVSRISAEVVFGWCHIWGGFFFFFFFSFKIMFDWLQKFIFSWYSVVFHL